MKIDLNKLPCAKQPNMTKANDIQHGGTHYKDMTIEPWDFISSNQLDFLEGSVVKYVSRWRRKAGLEDLMKAQHFLAKLIEVEQAKIDQAKKEQLAFCAPQVVSGCSPVKVIKDNRS